MNWLHAFIAAYPFACIVGAIWYMRCIARAGDQRQSAMDRLCQAMEAQQLTAADFLAACDALMKVDCMVHARRLMTLRNPWLLYSDDLRKRIEA